MTDKELEAAIARHPAGKKFRKKLELRAITTYMCCDHCGVNFLMDSSCGTHPDCHTVPCNEPGCEKGRTVNAF